MAARRRPRPLGPEPETVIVEVLLGSIWWILMLPFRLIFKKNKPGKSIGTIPPMVATEMANHWPVTDDAQAVAEADKLLDAALQAAAIPGNTMGERLKGASKLFNSALYQQIWDAHKLRNRLAHEVGAKAHDHEIHEALETFRVALRQLGLPL